MKKIVALVAFLLSHTAFAAAGDNYIINKNNGKSINVITTTGGGAQVTGGVLDSTQQWTFGASTANANTSHQMYGLLNMSGLTTGSYTLGGSNSTAVDTDHLAYHFVNTVVTGGTVGKHFQYAANKNGSGVHGWGTDAAGGMVFGKGTAASGLIDQMVYGFTDVTSHWTFGQQSLGYSDFHTMNGSLFLNGKGSSDTPLVAGGTNITTLDVEGGAVGRSGGLHLRSSDNSIKWAVYGATSDSATQPFSMGTETLHGVRFTANNATIGGYDSGGIWTLGPSGSTAINLSVNGVIDVANTSQATKQGVGAYLYKNSGNANTSISGVGLNFESGSAGVRVINGTVGNDGTWTVGPTSGGASLTHTIASGNVTTLQLFSPQNTSGLTGLQFRRGGGSIWNIQHDIATDQLRINQTNNGDVWVVNTAGTHTIGPAVSGGMTHIIRSGGQTNVAINSPTGNEAILRFNINNTTQHFFEEQVSTLRLKNASNSTLMTLDQTGNVAAAGRYETSSGSYTTTAGTDNIGLTLPNSSWWIVAFHNTTTAGSQMINAFCHASNLRVLSNFGGSSFGYSVQFNPAPSCQLQTTGGPTGATINWSAIRVY